MESIQQDLNAFVAIPMLAGVRPEATWSIPTKQHTYLLNLKHKTLILSKQQKVCQRVVWRAAKAPLDPLLLAGFRLSGVELLSHGCCT